LLDERILQGAGRHQVDAGSRDFFPRRGGNDGTRGNALINLCLKEEREGGKGTGGNYCPEGSRTMKRGSLFGWMGRR